MQTQNDYMILTFLFQFSKIIDPLLLKMNIKRKTGFRSLCQNFRSDNSH